ncbi:MAG: restriction endonuclease subunit S [bacterium]
MTFSIIKKSQLEGALRLDAEYYQPEYLELDRKLNLFGNKLKTFGEILERENSLTGGATPLGANYPELGIKFLRVQNIMPGYLDFSDTVFIDKKINDKQLKRSQLIDDDVLLTITGVSYGKSAVYKLSYGDANINQHSVRMHFISKLIPEYISTFLNSKFGRFQSDRKITGNTRPALAYEEIRSYKIPVIDKKLQNEIKEFYDRYKKLDEESKKNVRQAEDILFKKLGLDDFTAEKKLFFIVNFSDCKKFNRIDPDFFQPHYLAFEKIISKYKSKILGQLCSLISYGTVPTSPYTDKGVPYVKGMNLKNCLIDHTEIDCLEKDSTIKLPKKVYLKKDDVIISQMGTVGNAAVATKAEEGWLFASFTIRARLSEEAKKFLDPLFLTLLINKVSKPYYLMRYIAQSSVRQNTDLPTIKNLPVPILPKVTQEKIADLVRKSHAARQKSKQFLTEAKRKVEEMIEKGGDKNVD